MNAIYIFVKRDLKESLVKLKSKLCWTWLKSRRILLNAVFSPKFVLCRPWFISSKFRVLIWGTFILKSSRISVDLILPPTISAAKICPALFLLPSSVSSPRYLHLSWYLRSLCGIKRKQIIFVNFFWTDSILSISFTVLGDQIKLQYSRWGRTNEQYNFFNTIGSSKSFENLRIKPKTLVAFDMIWLMCWENFKFGENSTPRSRTELTFSSVSLFNV